MTRLLEARGVVKRFGGIRALDHVSLHVDRGEAVALVGPNGAGKTTFFNCLLGVLRPDEGSITFDGVELTRLAVHRRARLGIGRTFQRVELFGGLSVEEHLLVAELARRGDGGLARDLLGRGSPRAEERERVRSVLALLHIDDVASAPIESLSLGRSRLVELGRALIGEPSLLLLDEPSSGLDSAETAALVDVLRGVRQERGTAVLLVEHDLVMVQDLAERLYVLDTGAVLASGPCAEVLRDDRVVAAYVGAQG